MANSRQGEVPLEFIKGALGLSDASFEHARRDPELMTRLGQVAVELIAQSKALEMEKVRRKAYAADLENAQYDKVTGLYTRQAFLNAVCDLKEYKAYLLIIMDLRGVKAVNDTYGHEAGDRLLAGTARTLVQKGVRAGSVVGRWGGDEYALATPIEESSDPDVIMQRLYDLFSGDDSAELCDINDDGLAVRLSARFGFAAAKDLELAEAEHILNRADRSMTELAKQERSRGVLPPIVQRDRPVLSE